MVSKTEEIIFFLKDLSGANIVSPNSDIFKDLGMVGDDFHEIIEKYALKYAVDMKNYLWYFHTDEEGSWNSFGGLFFKPPYKRVNRIPITPIILAEFADKGKWELEYPNHEIPTKRYDLLINQTLFGIFLIIALIATINKCSK